MKRYQLAIPVVEATGTQFWEVDGFSPEDAVARYKAGFGEFIADELEVQVLGEPEVVDG